jgi:chemotaxis protein MotB
MIPRLPGRRGEEEASSGEGGGMMRWLITYADLITLLLAFFIVLYAISRTQQYRFSLIAKALAQEFSSKGAIVGTSPGPSFLAGQSGSNTASTGGANVGPSAAEVRQLNQLEQALQRAVNQAGLASRVSITETSVGVVVSVSDSLLFPNASAALSPTAVALLRRLGTVLETVPNEVVVTGYTDNVPIHTAQYPSNWQLSAMRAANVVQVLASVAGAHPGHFLLAGFSKYHPVASNATASGRAQNRRVNIVVLRNVVSQVVLPATGSP